MRKIILASSSASNIHPTDPLTDVAVSREAREAAAEYYPYGLLQNKYRDDLREELARFLTKKFAQIRTQDEGLVELLREIRACRSPGRVMETVHGPHRIGEGWNVSGLTKLLPRINIALSSKGQAALEAGEASKQVGEQ